MNSTEPTQYLFDPVIPSLAVAGSDRRFPVRRVYCVGRNYAEHAREMGHDPDREPPFFFTKHPDGLLPDGGVFPYPPGTRDVHHEIELVVAIGRGGADIPVAQALEHVYGYAVGLDMTRRDLQAEAKKMGRPWAVAKAFDHAAPCSALVPAAEIGHPGEGRIWLDINGETRQDGDLAAQIWSVAEVIAHLSRLFVLEPGDLVMTGTPAGVGPVEPGDRLSGGVQGIGRLEIVVGDR
ncbi:fumarylacetoacetate hydrolase [Stutzerimonas stutzeri]|uniref:Fumarylacetoacetate hydrolase n=1 Tax=Stutzerimonas stutzeri TaxID=316 RepID=A0A2N8T9A6_STUST|nr:fumarylacetoacetate hydrolase family protein [Stutzerimonas stutzeri]MCQ4325067.1 fumarylacetoacetate hydrolase family protein [Stutzerimonas stutzeri]PNG11357.1 fumarylacetoacetate hydrolase [Stutzerimonas stutzeri]